MVLLEIEIPLWLSYLIVILLLVESVDIILSIRLLYFKKQIKKLECRVDGIISNVKDAESITIISNKETIDRYFDDLPEYKASETYRPPRKKGDIIGRSLYRNGITVHFIDSNYVTLDEIIKE